MTRNVLLLSLATALASSAAVIQDFEGSPSFSTDYTTPVVGTCSGGSPLFPTATVAVTTDPSLCHASWQSFAAQAGTQMLVANGATASGLDVWRQTVTLTAAGTYTVTAWARPTFDLSLPTPQFFLGGSAIGSAATLTNGAWVQFSAMFTVGAPGSVSLSIRDNNLAPAGNDLALDTIEISDPPPPPGVIPEPSTIALVAGGLILLGLARRRK
jgi:hypothetical protein